MLVLEMWRSGGEVEAGLALVVRYAALRWPENWVSVVVGCLGDKHYR